MFRILQLLDGPRIELSAVFCLSFDVFASSSNLPKVDKNAESGLYCAAGGGRVLTLAATIALHLVSQMSKNDILRHIRGQASVTF